MASVEGRMTAPVRLGVAGVNVKVLHHVDTRGGGMRHNSRGRRHLVATSTRSPAPSLVIELAMWVLTVMRLMCSSSAISALVRPLAIVSSTCSSRTVRGSIGAAGGLAAYRIARSACR